MTYKYKRVWRILYQMAASSENGYLAGIFKLQLGWLFSRNSKEYRYEDFNLLQHDVVGISKWLPALRRALLPSSSEFWKVKKSS